MTQKPKQKCIWCPSDETYLLGVSTWIHYYHCAGCGADFSIDRRKHAWTKQEIDEHNEKYNEKIKNNA